MRTSYETAKSNFDMPRYPYSYVMHPPLDSLRIMPAFAKAICMERLCNNVQLHRSVSIRQ